MATVKWRGDAPAIAQMTTLTPGGTIEVGDKFKVTINGKTVAYSATGTTVASVTAGLAAALAARALAEFLEVAWTDDTTHVTGTGSEGVPFTVTVSTTEADDSAADAQTFAASTTTAASGPNFWSVGANWSSGSVPVSSDDVIFENSDVDVLYGLDQGAVTLASLMIAMSHTGRIGLRDRNATGTNSYVEYREQYLKIGVTSAVLGMGPGQGSGRIKLDTGSVQTTLNIFGTGVSPDAGVETLLWKGTHSSNQLNVNRGSVGVAILAGETATLATLRMGFVFDLAGDARVRCGSGLTWTTVEKSGGDLQLQSGGTTLTQTDGTTTISSGALTAANVRGGTLAYNSTGTLATANVGHRGTLDFSRDMRAKTATTCNRFGQGHVIDPYKVVTFTNGIDCEESDLTNLDLGTHIKVTRGVPA